MARSVALIGLVAAGTSGVARYTVALTRALGSVAEDFPGLHLRLLTTTTGAERVGEIGLQGRHGSAARPHVPAGPRQGRARAVPCRRGARRSPPLLRPEWAGTRTAPAVRDDDPRRLRRARLQRSPLRLQAAFAAVGAPPRARDRRHLGVRQGGGDAAPRRLAEPDLRHSLGPRLRAAAERLADAGLRPRRSTTSSTSATSLRARTCRSSCGRSSEASCRPRSYLPAGRASASQSCARPSRRRGRGSG